MGLNKDFRDFVTSDAADEPVFEVREDWREWQLQQAIINGDIYADDNPNTEFSSGWAEPDFEEIPEEDLDELALEKVTKLSKKKDLP